MTLVVVITTPSGALEIEHCDRKVSFASVALSLAIQGHVGHYSKKLRTGVEQSVYDTENTMVEGGFVPIAAV